MQFQNDKYGNGTISVIIRENDLNMQRTDAIFQFISTSFTLGNKRIDIKTFSIVKANQLSQDLEVSFSSQLLVKHAGNK